LNSSRRTLLHAGVAATAMAAASAAGSLLRPHELIADQLPPMDLAGGIPTSFGDWQQSTSGTQAIVNPQVESALQSIYSQLFNRTYYDARHRHLVMLAIAYGRQQSDALAVHLPDICYPSQGFEVRETRRETLDLGTHSIPVRRLVTAAPRRPEPLTYWTTVGNQAADGTLQRKLIQMRYGLRGLVPDGLVFRVSSIGVEPDAEFLIQQQFVQALVKAVPESLRERLVGRPSP
jgi:EpsI family protein